MAFYPIDMSSWERAEHYRIYKKLIRSAYNVTASIDVTALLLRIKKERLRFYPVFLYVLARAVNQYKEFRMGYNETGQLGYWDKVDVSYTIFHQDDKTFSDIWSVYSESFFDFYHAVCADMEKYKDCKGYRVKPFKPDACCPMSCTPWLSFSSVSFDTWSESPMLLPILTFGKYTQSNGVWMLPLSVYVSHAVADGYHTSCLFSSVQSLCACPDSWLCFHKI